jgi:hypothetical protein
MQDTAVKKEKKKVVTVALLLFIQITLSDPIPLASLGQLQVYNLQLWIAFMRLNKTQTTGKRVPTRRFGRHFG